MLQTYCCSQGVPKRQDPNNYSDTETKALSSISHSPVLYLYICYNHIAATLHRAYSLLKLHNGIAFNGFFIKVINIGTLLSVINILKPDIDILRPDIDILSPDIDKLRQHLRCIVFIYFRIPYIRTQINSTGGKIYL